MSDEQHKEGYIANALARGLAVLEAFSPTRPRQSLSDLADHLGLSRSAAYRTVVTLEQLGYLQRLPGDKRYGLSARVMRLGFHFLQSLEFVELAAPILDALRESTGLTAHLGTRDGTDVVYVYRALSRRTLVSNVPVGTRLPAHATSMGRILLTDVDAGELALLYRGHRLAAFSADTPTDLVSLQRRIDEDRRRGYVISDSSFAPGTIAIATAIRKASGQLVAAVNLSGPKALVDARDLEERLLPRLLEAAETISAYL